MLPLITILEREVSGLECNAKAVAIVGCTIRPYGILLGHGL